MKPQQSWSAKRATREPGNQSATTSNMVFQLNDAVRLFGKAKKPFLATRGAFYVILATIILFFMAAAAFAGPDRVSILIGSRHYPSGNYEELNPGVFVGWYDNRGNDWTVGAYRNSYGDPRMGDQSVLVNCRRRGALSGCRSPLQISCRKSDPGRRGQVSEGEYIRSGYPGRLRLRSDVQDRRELMNTIAIVTVALIIDATILVVLLT